ncbi:MAE_28990/MAE_18760 family HEPN-like nuclease [Cryobacterium zhongshanensis]|uniref:MAE_28990/MAE_18760 family HEPN-like nuclease n=1 Tax=Cryobacterium zhongshanensis TaxID=2928153 RepID=A0AA41QTF1_9MICO|nr:MAE_28990/MAE_18760 family HEPN-like nuclease [Cryobacterium zhongshanensis]MCI4657326.1 MAE_28990/MAE_18760 family HEPN-like nuclease [Cryobacterium zhongshanensis]
MPTLLEGLVDRLDGDLANRRREIVDFRLMVDASSGSRRDLLARACHVMAYAHWEGFVKLAIEVYLDYVLTRGLNVGSLNFGLQSLAVRTPMRLATEPDRSIERIADLLKLLDGRTTERFVVSPHDIVQTGNMTAGTLKALLGCVGLEYLPAYQTREKFIDSVVCGRRHRIAHGEWQPISGDDARAVAGDVLVLCAELNEQIQTAAAYETFLL